MNGCKGPFGVASVAAATALALLTMDVRAPAAQQRPTFGASVAILLVVEPVFFCSFPSRVPDPSCASWS